MRKRRAGSNLRGLMCLSALLLMAACSSEADDESEAATIETDAGLAVGEDAGSDSPGDVLVIAVQAEPRTLHPAEVGHNENNTPGMRNVFETLVDRDAATGELKPSLATSWERVDDNRWRFELREGVIFHDGSEFNAEVAGAALEYLMTGDGNGGPLGIAAESYGTEFTTDAVDEFTLEIITAAADPILPSRLYFLHIFSIEAMQDNPGSLVDTPVGTGPYRFVEWQRGQNLTIERNPDWWGIDAPDVAGVATIERAVFEFRPESSVRSAMVETGEAHVAMWIDNVHCQQVAQADDGECLTTGGPEVAFIRFDAYHDTSMFQDVRVREAFALALDIDSLANNLLEGDMIPSAQAVSDFVLGHDPELDNYAYDPDRAAQLLEEYRADGGTLKTVDLGFQDGRFPGVDDFAQAMGAMAEAVGFDVEITRLEPGAFIAQWHIGNQPPNRVILHTHGNRLGDLSLTARTYFEGPPVEGRLGCWCHEDEMFELFKSASVLAGDERQAAYRKANRHAYENFIMAYGGEMAHHYGVSSKFSWNPPSDHFLRLETMRLN